MERSYGMCYTCTHHWQTRPCSWIAPCYPRTIRNSTHWMHRGNQDHIKPVRTLPINYHYSAEKVGRKFKEESTVGRVETEIIPKHSVQRVSIIRCSLEKERTATVSLQFMLSYGNFIPLIFYLPFKKINEGFLREFQTPHTDYNFFLES